MFVCMLISFKAQLGEPFLGNLFFLLFLENRHPGEQNRTEAAKPALKKAKTAKRGVFQTGGFPDLDLSFLFCPFWGLSRFFPGFSRFAWGWFFEIRPFPLSRPIKSTYEEQSRKGPRHNLDLSPKKVGNTRVWKPPGLASLYNVQMDAAVLGDRLSEGTQKPLLGPGSPCSAGIERARKCLQGEHFVRCCHSTHGLLFRGSAGVTRRGQQQFATQPLRVRLLGIDSLNKKQKQIKNSKPALECPNRAAALNGGCR